MTFPKTERNRVRRIPSRGHYDKDTVYEILDAGFLCHVGFVVEGQPFVIPTLYGRSGHSIYIHGSSASRMLKVVAQGIDVCLTVTHVDGLVVARSAFHHSMNYRSVVVFGKADEVSGPEKEEGLFAISESVIRGRWEEARAPYEKELKATSVLRVTVESASAKVRTGPPGDEEEEDYALPIWAGVVPLRLACGAIVDHPQLRAGIPVPTSVKQLTETAK